MVVQFGVGVTVEVLRRQWGWLDSSFLRWLWAKVVAGQNRPDRFSERVDAFVWEFVKEGLQRSTSALHVRIDDLDTSRRQRHQLDPAIRPALDTVHDPQVDEPSR